MHLNLASLPGTFFQSFSFFNLCLNNVLVDQENLFGRSIAVAKLTLLQNKLKYLLMDGK